MKYMGSKRMMLQNGLGAILNQEISDYSRFIDLMCGAGSVAQHVAEQNKIVVNAYDLQLYAVICCNSVINRKKRINYEDKLGINLQSVEQELINHDLFKQWDRIENEINGNIKLLVETARNFCHDHILDSPVFNAYGGHYFSPKQALTIDTLLNNLPENEPKKSVFLAAILVAATKSAASPGHTAQPFQPTITAGKYIIESWRKDLFSLFKQELHALCPRHAKIVGKAEVRDAFDIISNFSKKDLVFIDPPYSSVQYSRFYHVLETIARQEKIEVSGKGRYPSIEERPQSTFSLIGQSKVAINLLIDKLSKTGCSVILTFPKERCSNGLSGDYIRQVAEEKYSIEEKIVPARMSTLGGNNSIRKSRIKRDEMILIMKPK